MASHKAITITTQVIISSKDNEERVIQDILDTISISDKVLDSAVLSIKDIPDTDGSSIVYLTTESARMH